MPPLRHGHFHDILILPVKMVELLQQHANTTVYWLKTLPLPIIAKVLHLTCGRVPRSIFENIPIHED